MSRQRAALALVLLAAAEAASQAAKVEVEWAKQSRRAIKHVLLVVGNNPQKPLSEILGRPDVLQALTEPFEEAARFTVETLNTVWQNQGAPASAYLDSLVSDVIRNSMSASPRMQRALYADRAKAAENLRKIAIDLARRAGLSVRVAETRSRAEAAILAIADQAKNKRWISRLDDATCSECRALHGMVLPVFEEFPADTGSRFLRVYGDLLGPPRHPRCRCRLVPA